MSTGLVHAGTPCSNTPGELVDARIGRMVRRSHRHQHHVRPSRSLASNHPGQQFLHGNTGAQPVGKFHVRPGALCLLAHRSELFRNINFLVKTTCKQQRDDHHMLVPISNRLSHGGAQIRFVEFQVAAVAFHPSAVRGCCAELIDQTNSLRVA